MKVVKPSPEEFQSLLIYMNSSELALDSAKFSLQNAQDNWEDLDDEDEDKILIKKLRDKIAQDEGIDIDDVDNRILMYEYLQYHFNKAFRWRGVYWAAQILLDNIQDPFDDCLAFHPCFEQKHVANEQ